MPRFLKGFKYFLLLLFLFAIPWQLKAAIIVPSDSLKVQPKDIFDVGMKIIGIKKERQHIDPSSTHRPFFAILPGIGYAPQLGFSFDLTTNLSFYIDSGHQANISTITVEPIYTFNHQFFVSMISNIWTKGNKLNLQGDWRFYSYPSQIYGLGGHTTLKNSAGVDYSHARFYQYMLFQLAPDLLFGPGYSLDHYWNIKTDNKGAGNALDYQSYGITPTSVSSGLSLNFLYDTRRNANNPRPGQFLNIVYRPNVTWMGSNTNWQSLIIDARKYFSFPANSDNILAFWSYDWLTVSGKPPYLDLPSTGWDTYANMGRGYIQGRFRGSNLLYFESEYRFRLSKNGLFGGVVFANIQTVSNYPSNAFDTYFPAFGAGLRIKANKFSNLNISLDYGIGVGGANGFFFNIGEVF